MKVFVTGATGYVGTAVVRELLDAGHRVVGLARSDEAVAALANAGAEAHLGSLDDPDSLRRGADEAEGVIHLAYVHDFSRIEASGAIDLRAVEAIGRALEGSGKPFVNTSGALIVGGLGRVATEEDAGPIGVRRVDSEDAMIAMAAREVRSSFVRLAPSVHDEHDKRSFIPTLIGIAREKGVSAYIGDGSNRWPAVHRLDAARLYRLALEGAPAGSRLHGVGEEGIRFRDIAQCISRRLKVPLVSVSAEEAGTHFGWLAAMASVDAPTSSAVTQRRLGWKPTQIGLLADLDQPHYFEV